MIQLLSVIGISHSELHHYNYQDLHSRVINNCFLKYLELNSKLQEGEEGFRIGKSRTDNIFSV